MKTIVELRASEGGDDSKLLIEKMADIYIKACRMNNFQMKVVE